MWCFVTIFRLRFLVAAAPLDERWGVADIISSSDSTMAVVGATGLGGGNSISTDPSAPLKIIQLQK